MSNTEPIETKLDSITINDKEIKAGQVYKNRDGISCNIVKVIELAENEKTKKFIVVVWGKLEEGDLNEDTFCDYYDEKEFAKMLDYLNKQ